MTHVAAGSSARFDGKESPIARVGEGCPCTPEQAGAQTTGWLEQGDGTGGPVDEVYVWARQPATATTSSKHESGSQRMVTPSLKQSHGTEAKAQNPWALGQAGRLSLRLADGVNPSCHEGRRSTDPTHL